MAPPPQDPDRAGVVPLRAGARRPTYDELVEALNLIADLASAPPTLDPPEPGFEDLDPPAA